MTVLGTKAPARPRPDDYQPRPWVVGGVVLVLVAGVVARFATSSNLWLDEALTVNIARLPLGRIPDALRSDGSPPLYYLVLHLWMVLVGSGDFATRALSGLMAVACLPLAWMVGRRLGGTVVGWASLLLMASSPFAIRYATEVRMYSMVVLLVLFGMLALLEVLDHSSPGWAGALAVTTGALLLTHYWAFYLVGVVAAGLLWRARRDPPPVPDDDPLFRIRPSAAGARRSLMAMALGSLAFVPWVPTFLHQMSTNGTPWGRPPTPRVLFDALLDFSGGYPEASLALGLVAYGLCGFGLFGRAGGDGEVHMDLRGRRPGRALAAVVAATLGVGVAVGQVTGSAFAIRYAAVAFPVVVVLMAMGLAVFPGRTYIQVAVVVTVALGFGTALPGVANERTTAGRVASVLNAKASPGDVVAYCPDQLGPSVSRLVPEGLVNLTFPRAASPQFMNWGDYAPVNRGAKAEPFARMLLERAGPDHDVWVVWAPGYRTFGLKCQQLITLLRDARPDSPVEVRISRKTFERPGLVRFRPQQGEN